MSVAAKLARPGGRRAAKEQQIRQAAARLFLEHGYGAVSMDAVARAAGVSKATIYAHFADKAALFETLIKEESARRWPDVAVLDAEPGDLRATLLAVATAYAELLVSPPVVQVFRMVVAEAPRFPELGRAFYEGGPRLLHDRLAAYLARAVAQGRLAIADPRLAAQQFFAMMRGEHHLLAVIGLDPPGTVPPSEIADIAERATDMFLRAYRAE